MSSTSASSPQLTSDLPDRQCRWCQTMMRKRLVGEGRFIHYTCPQCIFQHTSKLSSQSN